MQAVCTRDQPGATGPVWPHRTPWCHPRVIIRLTPLSYPSLHFWPAWPSTHPSVKGAKKWEAVTLPGVLPPQVSSWLRGYPAGDYRSGSFIPLDIELLQREPGPIQTSPGFPGLPW